MIERTKGVILRCRPLTETSLIVEWLTPDLGRLSTVAKGARRPKSPFAGKLDLFYLAEFSFQRSRRSQLHALREVKLQEPHRVLRRDLACLQQASYCAALVEAATEPESPLPGVYRLICDLLETIGQRPVQCHTIFAFELRLLDELGLGPDLEAAGLSAGARQILRMARQLDWSALPQLHPSPQQIAEINRFLRRFLAFHLGRVPDNREAAVQS